MAKRKKIKKMTLAELDKVLENAGENDLLLVRFGEHMPLLHRKGNVNSCVRSRIIGIRGFNDLMPLDPNPEEYLHTIELATHVVLHRRFYGIKGLEWHLEKQRQIGTMEKLAEEAHAKNKKPPDPINQPIYSVINLTEQARKNVRKSKK